MNYDKKLELYLRVRAILIVILIVFTFIAIVIAHRSFVTLQETVKINNVFNEEHLVKKTIIFTCDKPLYKNDVENLCDNNTDNKKLLKNIKNIENISISKHKSFDYQINNKNSIECIITYYDIKPGEKVPDRINKDLKIIEIVRANIAE